MEIDTAKKAPFKRRKRKLSNVEKLSIESQKNKYKCNCGHSVVIYPFEKKTKKICNWCHNYVYISKEEEFKDKLLSKLRK